MNAIHHVKFSLFQFHSRFGFARIQLDFLRNHGISDASEQNFSATLSVIGTSKYAVAKRE